MGAGNKRNDKANKRNGSFHCFPMVSHGFLLSSYGFVHSCSQPTENASPCLISQENVANLDAGNKRNGRS